MNPADNLKPYVNWLDILREDRHASWSDEIAEAATHGLELLWKHEELIDGGTYYIVQLDGFSSFPMTGISRAVESRVPVYIKKSSRYWSHPKMDGGRGLIMLSGIAGLHFIEIIHAPEGAWDHGSEDDYTFKITYRPSRAGWEMAWRLARQFSHATPGNPARIPYYLGEKIDITVGGELRRHILLPDGKEVA